MPVWATAREEGLWAQFKLAWGRVRYFKKSSNVNKKTGISPASVRPVMALSGRPSELLWSRKVDLIVSVAWRLYSAP